MKSDPHITYRRKPATLDCAALETFAQLLQDLVAKRREYHCVITNDAELQSLNRRFRGKDHPTDVLSFPAASFPSASSPSTGTYLGDIAISLQRARAQAKEFAHSPEDELSILLLHGLLHLTGLDHETDLGQMARTERRWQKKLGLPTSLTQRTKTLTGKL